MSSLHLGPGEGFKDLKKPVPEYNDFQMKCETDKWYKCWSNKLPRYRSSVDNIFEDECGVKAECMRRNSESHELD